ncbi:hypothetical protein AYI70_g805 [Smittium culicis]|uniref:Uncharacterized protein n=1 Tax=Smittium culicis TaxID=133412 RepID=A0A1R1YFD1_9FUNG|nr:hypothetical protein AYI70_g805 [Smittium culicis]
MQAQTYQTTKLACFFPGTGGDVVSAIAKYLTAFASATPILSNASCAYFSTELFPNAFSRCPIPTSSTGIYSLFFGIALDSSKKLCSVTGTNGSSSVNVFIYVLNDEQLGRCRFDTNCSF